MRLAAHLATAAALLTLGLGLGRWLRDPTLGGLLFLLLLCAGAVVAVRHIYPRARDGEPAAEPDPRVDLNAASAEELQRLPGVGPVAARRIVEEREANGPFASVEALVRVPGFGPAKVRVIAPEARVSGSGPRAG